MTRFLSIFVFSFFIIISCTKKEPQKEIKLAPDEIGKKFYQEGIIAMEDGDFFYASKIFSDAEILQIPNSDYKFRSFIPRYKVIEKIKEELENINYPNFKNEVGKHDLERASNYSKIWQIMYNFQNKRNP